MKRIILTFFAALALVSCEDIQDNSPAMQGTLDEDFFKATAAQATRVSGSGGAYVIQGLTDDETLTLRVPGPQSGTYVIEDNPEVYASFKDFNGNIFLTDPLGDGEIVINRWDTTDKTLSGTFRFTAHVVGVDTLIVQHGIFHNVRYTVGEDIDDPGAGAGIMVAKLDGEDFAPGTVTALDNGTNVKIKGITDEGSIEIRVPNDVAVGTYSTQDFPFYGRFKPPVGNTENSISGTITVVIHLPQDRVLKGTFAFETANHSIAFGQFNVQY